MKELEEMIQKAVARGIVPGAVARSPYGSEWVVGAIHGWDIDSGGGLHDRGTQIYSPLQGCWATVITAAPKDQTRGLIDGMACEPDEHMRRAIVEKARELGFTDGAGHENIESLVYSHGQGQHSLLNDQPKNEGIWITPGEFYDRLCRTEPVPQIFLFDQEVKFGKGYVQVGDQSVPNDTIRKIVERMQD